MSAQSWPELAVETDRRLALLRERLELWLLMLDPHPGDDDGMQVWVSGIIDDVQAVRDPILHAIARPAE